MIGLSSLYILNGLFFAAVALLNALDPDKPNRYRSALFWAINAVILITGDWLGPFAVGCLVIVSCLCAAVGGLGAAPKAAHTEQERTQAAAHYGKRLLIPALAVPFVTLLGAIGYHYLTIGATPLVDPEQTTLIALGTGVLVALGLALVMLRRPPGQALIEGRRLLDTIGWAAILPQMLAALGAIFASAGVGEIVADLITGIIPMTQPLIVVAAYCLGMALFTVIMGNAFAAFPVMTAGIGLPFLVNDLHGNPAIMAAIGMLSGFCGTMLTPMAANFNIVPAALLELPDQNAVIKVQWPTALLMLLINIILMYSLVFRF